MIRECSPQKLLHNLNEIASYLQVRSTSVTITNTARLIPIIRSYFETLLFHLHHSIDGTTVNINGKIYRMAFTGRDTSGNAISRPISEMNEIIIKYYFEDLAKIINKSNLNDLLSLLNEVFETPQIPLTQKLFILNNESLISSGRWSDIIRIADYRIAIKTIGVRKSLLIDLLKLKHLSETDIEQSDESIMHINIIYLDNISNLLRIHLHNNHYPEIFSSIQNELTIIKSIPDACIVNKNILIRRLLAFYIKYNYIITLFEWSTIEDLIDDYRTDLSDDNFKSLSKCYQFDLTKIKFANIEVGMENPIFPSETSNINTSISFVLPYTLKEQSVGPISVGNSIIYFNTVSSLYDDPCFSFLESIGDGIEISAENKVGFPLSIISDSIGRVYHSTVVTIIFDELFNPDFEIKNGKVIYHEYAEADIPHDEVRYPHKDSIIKIFRELQSRNILPIDISNTEITSKFISNYFVAYHDGNKQLIHHKIYTITNFNSYELIKNRYLNAINSIIIDEDLENFREFLLNTQITSRKTFHEFCYKLIEKTFKTAVEYRGLWQLLWTNNNKPIKEVIAHPVISSSLNDLCYIKGIQLSREEFTADGNVDFFMSFNHNSNLFGVGIEVKNAHNDQLHHGIQTQLPLYLEGKRTKRGIYFVLWYKCNEYGEPTAYTEISDMIKDLQIFQQRYDIRILVVDCSRKISPSKIAASSRLSSN